MGFSISNLFSLFSRGGKLADEIKADKAWYCSRTIWINLLSLWAWAMVSFFNIDLGVNAEMVSEIAGGITALINIVLRFDTHKPITKGKNNE